ncbi:MAG TPA: MTAP family purine nucleoside phosphorylase [Candidatus Hypogeohydataceae bacterium YC41]
MSGLYKFAVIGGSQAYDLLSRGAIQGKRLGERKTPFGPSQPIYLLAVDIPKEETEGAYKIPSPLPALSEAEGMREGRVGVNPPPPTQKMAGFQPTPSRQGRGIFKVEFFFLSRHGERGYEVSAPFVNYRANIYALKDMGVNKILAWSGPGAINPRYKVGQFVVVDDLIDETWNRESTFFEKGGLGFIRQNPVFCPSLRNLMVEVLKGQGLNFSDKGVYVCTQGPRLETPAEIKKFASYGGDLVGMTLVPEVFLARELEMCYAALCYVSNYAEGVVKSGVAPPPFKAGELFEGLSSQEDKVAVAQAVSQFPAIIQEIARRLHMESSDIVAGAVAPPGISKTPLTQSTDSIKCPCQSSMERYRREGRIGEDWRKWIKR